MAGSGKWQFGRLFLRNGGLLRTKQTGQGLPLPSTDKGAGCHAGKYDAGVQRVGVKETCVEFCRLPVRFVSNMTVVDVAR